MSAKLTCDGCDGKCCKYVVIEIDVPESLEDFENIKWYVAHKNLVVFVGDDGTWNLEIITTCKHLDEKNRCSIYETRPKICREYSEDDCPFHNEYVETQRFESIKDVEEYIEKIFKTGLHVVPKEGN